MRNRADKNGMTIIEMMIACVIIGILASIAVLTLANTRKHAIATEAIVGLSSLKQAMKHYYAEYGDYQDFTENNGFLDRKNSRTYPTGINPGFVDGAYFRDECYKVELASDKIKCYPALSTNPYGARIADGGSDAERSTAYIALDLNDSFSQHNVSCSGYKSE